MHKSGLGGSDANLRNQMLYAHMRGEGRDGGEGDRQGVLLLDSPDESELGSMQPAAEAAQEETWGGGVPPQWPKLTIAIDLRCTAIQCNTMPCNAMPCHAIRCTTL